MDSAQHHSSLAVLTPVTVTKMKQPLLLTLTLLGYTLAEAPYPASGRKPQGAQLLLPPVYTPPPNRASPFQGSDTEDINKVSDKLRARLGQEAGLGYSSYHIYLPDGRLHKVQYTTALLKSGQQSTQQWNYPTSSSQQYSNQYNQAGEENSLNDIRPRIQSERLQQDYLPTYSLTGQYSSQQQTGQQPSQQYGQPLQNGQYNQYKQPNGQEKSNLNPIIAQFGRLQQGIQQQQIEQLNQRQQQLEQEQQSLREQQEQLRSSSYVASIQYSNVDPVTAPIYSYKPPVTGILRYAP